MESDLYKTSKAYNNIITKLKEELSKDNKNNVLNNIKFIIFEGGDFSGKTTQAVEYAKRLDKCMVVHFPRTKKFYEHSKVKKNGLLNIIKETSDIYEKTSKVLYNKNFWIDYFYQLKQPFEKNTINEFKYTPEGSGFLKRDNILRECLNSNIYFNFIDKIMFFVDLKNFLTGEIDSLEYNMDYTFYYEGKLTEDPEKIKEILEYYKNNDSERTIIFDRFILSGKIYNAYIPKVWVINEFLSQMNLYNYDKPLSLEEMISIIKNYYTSKKDESFNGYDDYLKELFESNYDKFIYLCELVDYITIKQYECDTKLVMYLNDISGFNIKISDKLPYVLFKDFNYFKTATIEHKENYNNLLSFYVNINAFKDNTLNNNFININCYRSNKLFNKIMSEAQIKSRKMDSYDKNTIMQEIVNKYFEEAKKTSFDLSKIIQNVDVFKTTNAREKLFLNTMHLDSDKYFNDDKDIMIREINDNIFDMIRGYIPENEQVIIDFNRNRDDIRYSIF